MPKLGEIRKENNREIPDEEWESCLNVTAFRENDGYRKKQQKEKNQREEWKLCCNNCQKLLY